MQTEIIEYYDDDTLCKGYFAYDETKTSPQPTVLIAHALDGITDFVREYAANIVNEGYAAFCVDIFGEGRTENNWDDCIKLVMPFIEDRAMLQRRILAGFHACQSHAIVNQDKIAATGFCFGGTAALDLARSGADIKAVACQHGLLSAPENVEQNKFTAKALILHGYDDPQVPPDQLPLIADELTAKNVDWQFVYFGHTKHAFTREDAAEIGAPEMGRVYNADSARRAWQYCQLLFREVLA